MTGSRTFGSWLKQQRRGLDLTQKELAQRAGCSTVTIHKIETGACRPSKDIAERLAFCLEISPDARAGFVRFARGGLREVGLDHDEPGATARLPLNLPVPATQLIGREDDLATIRKRLKSGARLITLTGSPGVGKTRLALEVACQVGEDYPDGVFFVSLAALADPARVAKAIGQGLNIAEARTWPMAERIKTRLREKQILLVLDNFEQVIEAAAFVADLLAACPWLTILATSRQALRVHSERLYVVRPLPVPVPGAGAASALTAAEALAYPAIALFVERAEAALADFTFTDGLAETVAEICRRLDGLPLAIELLASRVNLFTPAELLQHWTGPWILTSAGLRDAPPRQQTLHDAIDWSYRLLDDREKALLRQLAVFARGADLAAIEAVCGPPSLDRLASLLDQSLAQRITGPEPERRFLLLDTVREYGLVRLAEASEEFATRLNHARYFRLLVAAGRMALGGPQQFDWFRRLELERSNLHTALDWTLQRDGVTEREAAELGIGLASDLYGFWWLGSHLREGLNWLERALEVAGRCDEELALPELLWMAGACAGHLGLGRKSRSYLDTCIDMARSTLRRRTSAATPAAGADSDANRVRRALAHGLELRAFFSVEPAALQGARADLDEAVVIIREAGNALDLAHALISYGHWASRNGELDLARAALEESLSLCRRAGNVWGVTLVSGDLVCMYEYAGEFDKAYSQWSRDNVPPVVAEQLGEHVRVHVVLWWLHYLAASEGDEERRLGVFRKAVAMQGALGYQSFVSSSLYEPVYLALQAGMPVRAVRLTGATQVWVERLGLPLDEPPQLVEALARVRTQLGEAVFAQAWGEGHAMTIPASAAYALSGEE